MRSLSFILFIHLISITSYSQEMDSIRKELENIHLQSLRLRSGVFKLVTTYGPDSKQMDSVNAVILASDSAALTYVSTIIDTHGWLGVDKIGHNANQALFLSIQHSDLKTMEKYAPFLRLSVQEGKSGKPDLALLEDRILTLKSLPQKFGTQYTIDSVSNKPVYYPTEDIANIEKRRREMGLGSFRKFTRENGISLPQ